MSKSNTRKFERKGGYTGLMFRDSTITNSEQLVPAKTGSSNLGLLLFNRIKCKASSQE